MTMSRGGVRRRGPPAAPRRSRRAAPAWSHPRARSGSSMSSIRPPRNAQIMPRSKPSTIATPTPMASTRSGVTPPSWQLGQHADFQDRRDDRPDGCAEEAHVVLPAPDPWHFASVPTALLSRARTMTRVYPRRLSARPTDPSSGTASGVCGSHLLVSMPGAGVELRRQVCAPGWVSGASRRNAPRAIHW